MRDLDSARRVQTARSGDQECCWAGNNPQLSRIDRNEAARQRREYWKRRAEEIERDHVLKGEQMPDPRSDSSFQKYVRDEDFVKLMKTLGFK